jgi:hypothetical protein
MSGETPLGYLRQINEKMDRLLLIAERYVPTLVAAPVAEPVAEPAAEPAAAAAAIPRIPIVQTTAQSTVRTLRRLQRGVEASERPKIEKQIRDLQPKIDAEIAAGIPIESEFQGQYDAAVLYLTREGLKPEMRAKMERVRNELKAKLNAEKEHGIARGGSKKRKTRKRQTRSRRNY